MTTSESPNTSFASRLGWRWVGAGQRRQERKLDFVGVGVQKSGTTSLHHLLAKHPGIEMPKTKELHYFERDDAFGKDYRPRAGDYGRLHRHFYFDRPIAGEITPIYLYWRHALERIQAYNPDVRIIVLLRNPVHRAYSQWGHYVRKSRRWKYRHLEIEPFRARIDKEMKRTKDKPGKQKVRLSHIHRSLYGEQVKRAKALFAPEQLLFVKSEDFFRDQLGVTDSICRFLGAAPLTEVADIDGAHYNVGVVAPISRPDWQAAYALLADDITIVENELGWDCSDWRTPPPEDLNTEKSQPA